MLFNTAMKTTLATAAVLQGAFAVDVDASKAISDCQPKGIAFFDLPFGSQSSTGAEFCARATGRGAAKYSAVQKLETWGDKEQVKGIKAIFTNGDSTYVGLEGLSNTKCTGSLNLNPRNSSISSVTGLPAVGEAPLKGFTIALDDNSTTLSAGTEVPPSFTEAMGWDSLMGLSGKMGKNGIELLTFHLFGAVNVTGPARR